MATRLVWIITTGIPAAILGAWLTELVDTHLLLLVTAALLGWQSVSIIRGGRRRQRPPGARPHPAPSP